MQQTQACSFTHRYSEIRGFQMGKTVTYSAERIPDGVRLSVRQESGSDIHTEDCVCSSEPFENVIAFMQYICENSIGIGTWYDILRDRNIQFTVA